MNAVPAMQTTESIMIVDRASSRGAKALVVAENIRLQRSRLGELATT